MQEQQREESRRGQLPPLAPRRAHASSSSSTRDRDSGSGSASGSARPPRLSHRSRAGCWTCRARKVKCDEIHPKCGPCTRLSRTCDWDHRWNFSDATLTTQSKYLNVTTSGNAVWDPSARSSPDGSPNPNQLDDLPAFSALTNDDDRERKAGTQLPGTFGVVVTPESFSELPEYAGTPYSTSRRASVQSQTSSLCTVTNNFFPFGRAITRSQTDPNVVVLDRFEEGSPTTIPPYPLYLDTRRPSLPERLLHLSMVPSPTSLESTMPPSPATQLASTDDPFVSHFRHYLVPRLVQPQLDDAPLDHLTANTRDLFELEARNSPTLHQAICALSALNLSHTGRASVDAAHAHYGQALSPLTTTTSPSELLSNGTFLSHFLLFIYDMCIHVQPDEAAAATNMWAIHLEHLQRIAVLRHQMLGPEAHGYLIWTICEFDVYACLLGSGDGTFVRNVLEHDMLPLLEKQIPASATPMLSVYAANEVAVFPAILALRQTVFLQLVELAQAARGFRQQAAGAGSVTPGMYAGWQAAVAGLQGQLAAAWAQAYPPFLVPESPQAAADLPPRPRYVFEQAFLLHQLATLYARTSMFPHQRALPLAAQTLQQTDSETRVRSILHLAASYLPPSPSVAHRHVLFPLFIAGIATSLPDTKVQILNLMKAFEGGGVGGNEFRTRRLLSAVLEEQRRVVREGGRGEEVDWVEVGRGAGLGVVNCGL